MYDSSISKESKMKEKGLTTITLKKINRDKVYQYIYRQRETSKLQIVQDLQMGLSTVSQNLNELEQDGLISRDGYFESTGGRKAQVIKIVENFRISIGLGILKDMFHIVAVNLYGEALATETIPLAYENSDNYYAELARNVEQFIQNQQYDPKTIEGISIATQGIISTDGTMVTYGDIMGNTTMQLSDFSSKLPYPCHLEHDSKAAADLELWNHPQFDSALIFLLNPNLGGAIITNHEVHQGNHMRSGLFEHICIDPNGPVCYCGKHGCLETYCSANALKAAAGMPIKEFFHVLHTTQAPTLQKIWWDYLDHLAFAMHNLSLVIDCPIIISGYLAPYFRKTDLQYLSDKINEQSLFPFTTNQLFVGNHGQYTPAIGAALYYIKEFLSPAIS